MVSTPREQATSQPRTVDGALRRRTTAIRDKMRPAAPKRAVRNHSGGLSMEAILLGTYAEAQRKTKRIAIAAATGPRPAALTSAGTAPQRGQVSERRLLNPERSFAMTTTTRLGTSAQTSRQNLLTDGGAADTHLEGMLGLSS